MSIRYKFINKEAVISTTPHQAQECKIKRKNFHPCSWRNTLQTRRRNEARAMSGGLRVQGGYCSDDKNENLQPFNRVALVLTNYLGQ